MTSYTRPSTTGEEKFIRLLRPKCGVLHGQGITRLQARLKSRTGKRKGKKKSSAANNEPQENPEALRWKRLALTKKKKLRIKIPQRQFIGESRELSDRITEKTENEIRNILNL